MSFHDGQPVETVANLKQLTEMKGYNPSYLANRRSNTFGKIICIYIKTGVVVVKHGKKCATYYLHEIRARRNGVQV